jgi:acyl-coenzyme A synthetase/AMP-(fatty) acid ligase
LNVPPHQAIDTLFVEQRRDPPPAEPINPEAWVRYREHLGGGRTPVVDTWWQTEIGISTIEVREHVGRRIGKIAMPANIVFTPELAKTRSGKIMRRLLRDVAEQRTLGDTSTLADPTMVEEIQRQAATKAAGDED